MLSFRKSSPVPLESLNQFSDFAAIQQIASENSIKAASRSVPNEPRIPLEAQREAVAQLHAEYARARASGHMTMEMTPSTGFLVTQSRPAVRHPRRRSRIWFDWSSSVGPAHSDWIHDPANEAVVDRFELRNPHAVRAYLNQMPELYAVLQAAHRRICDSFASLTGIALEVYNNPEDPNDRKLFVIVQTTQPTEEAVQSLDALDASWWLNASSTYGNRMNIDVEFA